MTHDDRSIRFAAESLYQNANNMYRQYPSIDFSRSSQTHSINVYTEDFLAGFMQDGRMSVVRRFFCLFVTFDLFFISLLWLICILITGDDIWVALRTQILEYSVHKSLFDIVMAAICRFTVLILFYALLYTNHWFIVAMSTSGSCAFLIYKVFAYTWADSQQPVFQVLLIIISFVLAWGETWFLDFRVIPQERHARNYITAVSPHFDDRTPLMAPFLQSVAPPESLGNFYSPYDSAHNSDDDDEQDEDFKEMGKECVRRASELLEASDWKLEKLTNEGDTIKSTNRAKLGKVWRLTARLPVSARNLLEHLFYKIEEMPKWNPTILESRVIRHIDSHTDISYQATAGAAGGIVKSRDFVNLRCWHLCRDGQIVDPLCIDDKPLPRYSNGSDKQIERDKGQPIKTTNMLKSQSDATINDWAKGDGDLNLSTLSKSLGAKRFFDEDATSDPSDIDIPSDDDDDDVYEDTEHEQFDTDGKEKPIQQAPVLNNVYVSSAISIVYAAVPQTPKYIRGDNLLSCWAMREINGKHNDCIFEWLLCLDLKGYFPRYVLDTAYTTLMQDYMVNLRKYCTENILT